MQDNILKIGITGHRDIQKIDYKPLQEKIRLVFREIIKNNRECTIQFLTPLAAGADRLAAYVALEDEFKNQILTVVPIPFDLETYKTTLGKGITGIEPEDSINEFELLLKKIEDQQDKSVRKIILMPFDKYKYNLLPLDKQRAERRMQYSMVGEYIALKSKFLIALYDESTEEKEGGTKEIVRKKITANYKYFDLKVEDIDYEGNGIIYSISTPRSDTCSMNTPYQIKRIFENNVEKIGLD